MALVVVHIHAGCLNAAPLNVPYMELFPVYQIFKDIGTSSMRCLLYTSDAADE